ncbi:unnamed protein product [Tuber melanosporum]|uniref:(Perigord truffle) hypothetical protein n=1 Tax=Tuber melanosporum (strain Mel28) TaxID=656061 RepID=D5GD89_TUBMM|nr:uncharacterized protein GSTUM_00006095001 [Tuber melanosporum]CAZ82482.1 unnamed protein product [Tuber melanosporum]
MKYHSFALLLTTGSGAQQIRCLTIDGTGMFLCSIYVFV